MLMDGLGISLRKAISIATSYSKKMDEMLAQLAAASSDGISHPYFEERDVKKKTLVIFASDRGLCGSFNANVFRRAFEWLDKNKDFECEIGKSTGYVVWDRYS